MGVLAWFWVASAARAAQPQLVDRVVAVIEDEIITERELETKAESYLAQLSEIPDAEKRAAKRLEILKQVLDIEIGDRIVNREIAQNKHLGVTDKDVDKAVEEVLRMNHLTRDQLQAALYGQGLTWTEYRKKLQQQIERARLVQMKVQNKVQIKDAYARRRCEERQRLGSENVQVCASHILIQIPPHATAEDIEALHARASKLQSELASGGDFSAYALQYSDDKGTPDGKLGCFHHGEMVEAFDAAAFALPVGGISPVVRTEFGFHIIKVTDRRSASSAQCDTDQALEPFKNELFQEEMQRQMTTYVEELRKKAFVEVRL